MKYLPLFTLGFLINLLFFLFLPINVKADDCFAKRAGDSCGAHEKWSNDAHTQCQTCYGTCIGNPLTCNNGEDYCSNPYVCGGSTEPIPTPTIDPNQPTPPTSTLTPTPSVTPTCPPSRTTSAQGNTNYVQDKSLKDDEEVARVAGTALLPRIVYDDATKSAKDVSGTQVDTQRTFYTGFLDGILTAFITLLQALPPPFNITLCKSINSLSICQPKLSVGITEGSTDWLGNSPPGQNTKKFAIQAKVLGQTAIPQGTRLIAEVKDCNLGTGVDDGNKNLDALSNNLGTTTGYYGNDMPDFKSLNPNNWNSIMQARMTKEGLNIWNQVFDKDKRSADIYLRKQVFCKGNYPNGICPFEPTPATTR